jgi:hypothetical protein
MSIRIIAILLVSHLAIGSLGFGLGIYALPILIAPEAPTNDDISTTLYDVLYQAEFKKDLKGSDTFHWGEGRVSVGTEYITFLGELAPGPDYKLYLSPEFVETEAEFNQLKPNMVNVGEVRTFDNFIVEVPTGTDVTKFNSVIVWCETFGEFISAAKYQ